MHIKIGTKKSGSGAVAYRLQFGDLKLYKFFEKIGLTPNKSLTIGAVKIPDKYFFDFVRGLFDGDGCIYGYCDSRWENSYMFYVGFTSGSLVFLEWLQKVICNHLAIKGFITQGTRGFQLRYAKRESIILWNAMYYSENVLCLSRKFTKAQKIFSIEAGVKKS